MMNFLKHFVRGQNSIAFQATTIAVMLLTLTSGFFITFSWQMATLTAFMYVMTIGVGVSVTYHRYLTHHSFKMHPVLSYIGRFFAAMSGTGSPVMWVLTHRMHHVNSDKEFDPHPPKKILHTLFGKYTKVDTNSMSTLIRDPFNKFLHQYYFAILTLYGAFWALFGVEFFYYGFVFPIFVAVIASNLLNVLGHSVKLLGYRSYNTSDKSSNNIIMGFLGFGEGWHNNHHRFPGSANFGLKNFELDIGFILIKIWEPFGLVTKINQAK